MLRRIIMTVTAVLGAAGLATVAVSASGTTVAVARTHPAAAGSICGTVKVAPKYKHVILIMEENNSYSSIIGSSSAPYLNSLAKACGLATDYHNITHPSLPNYIAITSATPLSKLGPFSTDCDPGGSCLSKSTSLFSQTAGKWKSYVESMPSACDHTSSGQYAAKHNPAVYYTDLTTCKTDDVPLGTLTNSALLKDFSSETTAPAFSVVTPNLCDDMHDCSVATGDSWLKQWIPKITATTVYKAKDTAIFIIWDEGEGGSYATLENCAAHATDVSCHVAAIVVAPSVPAGARVATAFTHFSFVRTVDGLLGLPALNAQSKAAASMVAPFNL
jgi:hypothetical protein